MISDSTPPGNPPADVIATAIRALTPHLAEPLGEVIAAELVEWLVSLHDRLLYVEAQLLHVVDDLQRLRRKVVGDTPTAFPDPIPSTQLKPLPIRKEGLW